MIVTAILAIRDEAPCLANCLRHLVRNGVRFAIIDNDSSDGSAEIYRRAEFADSLVAVVALPYAGDFALVRQLECKMALAGSIDTDWLIHLDADEVMHSRRADETLCQALARIDAQGWNVVNFDEFVFLPIEGDYVGEAASDQPMPFYYFFQPHAPRLMRAWRKASGFSLVEGAGHTLVGSDLRLAPEYFVLRHYIFRSQQHAFDKYAARRFAVDEQARGWHANRIDQPRAAFAFPDAALLKRLAGPDERELDRSDPWPVHYWQRGDAIRPAGG